MLYFLSFLCIAAAIALWLRGDKKQITERSNVLPMPTDDAVRDGLVALQREYPQVLSLSLPMAPVEYDGWIEEMLKRARMRTWGLTREQEATLIGQLTALQDRKLAYVDTTRKLSQAQRDLQRDEERAAARRKHDDELEEKRHAAEQVELELKIAEAQDKLDRLKEEKTKRNNPPQGTASPRRDPVMDAIASAMKRVDTITALEQKRDEEKRRHPELAPLIDREFRKIIDDMREKP
jgi:uncharacterized protein YdiU (UPF0061 family)